MYNPLLPPSVKGSKVILDIFKQQSDEIRSIPPAVLFEKTSEKIPENSQKNIRDIFELIFNTFANLQVGKYAEFHISSNKHWASNKRLPQVSPTPNSFKI